MKPKTTDAITKISEKLDLPPDTLSGQARVTLVGSRSVRVESHRGLLEYDTALISVNCGEKILGIYGQNLEILSMNAVELLIRGDVSRIELS
jgi:sporulation protein YqfC